MKTYDIAAYIWPSYTGKESRSRIFWPNGIGEWQTVQKTHIKENGAYIRQNNYLVLHFNRDKLELEIAVELSLEGSVDIMRGVYIDGYFHMFGSNDFKTAELK